MKRISFETARLLKKAGFPQESEFYWVMYSSEEGGNGTSFLVSKEMYEAHKYSFSFSYAAPIAEEVLEQLPHRTYIPYGEGCQEIDIKKTEHAYTIRYLDSRKPSGIEKMFIGESNLAEAAAKMYLYLKENKLI